MVTCPTGTSSSGQLREERQKDAPAHLPMQAAHAIDLPAPANCQIRHVERLRRVVRVLAAKSQQIMERNAELLLGVSAEVLLDEGRRETVKARRHRRVRSEEIAGSSRGQRHVEGLPRRLP